MIFKDFYHLWCARHTDTKLSWIGGYNTDTIHLRPVQYNTTYPSKPGSAFEIMYTFYIGINDVPLLVVDFGYFFSSWGWGGSLNSPKYLFSFIYFVRSQC